MGVLSHRVLVVDDDPLSRALVRTIVQSSDDLEVVGEAASGTEAVQTAKKCHPDVVIMDVDMPRLGGARATELIVEQNPSTRVLAFTGHIEAETVTSMIVAGAVGYTVKGAAPDELLSCIRSAANRTARVDSIALPGMFDSLVSLTRKERERRREVERMATQLEHMFDDTIRALAGALHSRDGYTGDHDDRVAESCVKVGRQLGLAQEQLRDLRYGGIFHDIGKIGIPDEILHKTSSLSEDEWRIVKQHTIMGEEILSPIDFLVPAAKIVRHSHEHWDGSGYPDHLREMQIPLGSRIVFACDAYDAITTDRTYQKGRSHDEALELMDGLRDKHFDSEVLDVLFVTANA